MSWEVVSPAPRSAALALAPPLSRMRKQVLFQAGHFDTMALYLDGAPMKVSWRA